MDLPQLKLAARDLSRNPTRTAISLSAIGFGVVALLISGGFVEWIFWAMREAAIETGLGHLQISRPSFHESGFADPNAFVLSENDRELQVVRETPGVAIVGERMLVNGLASSGDTTLAFTGEAVDPVAELQLSKVLRIQGRNLDHEDPTGILLGKGLAAALGAQPGDTVSLIVNLPSGGINAVDSRVRGIFSTQVTAVDDHAVRMNLELARSLLKSNGSHLWVVALDDIARTDETVVMLRNRLPPNRFEIKSWHELSDFYRKSVTLLSRQIDVVVGLIALLIVLGISNTLTMSVIERTGEIGTILAIGTRRARVLQLFVLQGLLLGIAGAVCGLVLGYLLAGIISYFGIPMPPPPGRDAGYRAEIVLTMRLAFWGGVVAVVPSVLASLYPALKAARMPIVDALRHNR